MKFNDFTSMITRSLNKVAFSLEEKSPELYIAGGIALSVFALAMAIKASDKVQPVLSEAKDMIDAVHDTREAGETTKVSVNENGETTTEVVPYTVEDSRKDLVRIYVGAGKQLAKIYLPAMCSEVASIALILAGHNKMAKRNAALTAAYATISESFRMYRERTEAEFGAEKEQEIRHNTKSQVVSVDTVEDSGEVTTKDELMDVVQDPDSPSDYARFFCRPFTNASERSHMANRIFLDAQENYANDLLVSRGYLFLNEVYEALGFRPTYAGQVVGWIYDSHNPNGDNRVCFNRKEVARMTEDGRYEKVYMIDPNVDGEILTSLRDRGEIATV